MQASQIMDHVARLALDEDHVRWPLSELAIWINDAQREVALLRPSAFSSNTVLSLVQGTRQELDAAHVQLLRVIRNVTLGTGGARIGGRVVRVIGREVLDAQVPDWHMSRAVPFSPIVKHFIFDEEDPRGYYVYPGNTGTGMVEGIVVRRPREIAAQAGGNPEMIAAYAGTAAALDLEDIYFNPVVDYVLYRMHTKDMQAAGAAQRAAAHYQQFVTALGLKAQSDLANSPNPKGAGVGAN
jgi:hypothetical protein